MEKFEFKVDINTPYIKLIRFSGTLLLGFFIGATIFTYKFTGSIDWMNSATSIFLSSVFAFFPGVAKRESIMIDEEGIAFFNYFIFGGKKKKFEWQSVKAIGVKKNVLEIKNSIGAFEKIKLPLHTSKQREELISYLQQISKSKELEYLK